MLTEKDYCDYDTCVALKELGYPTKMTFVSKQATIEIPINSGLIQLYEAQKWLREIHNIFVMIDRSFAASNSWHYVICANDDFKHLIEQPSLENYSYEEALSEGIKECIKLLQLGIIEFHCPAGCKDCKHLESYHQIKKNREPYRYNSYRCPFSKVIEPKD